MSELIRPGGDVPSDLRRAVHRVPLDVPRHVRLRGVEPGGPGSTPPRRYRVAPQ